MIRVFSTEFGFFCRLLDPLDLGQHVLGRDHIGVKFDLARRIGGANLGNALDSAVAYGVGDRQASEEGFKRHCFVDFNEDVLIAAKRVPGIHLCATSRIMSDAVRAAPASARASPYRSSPRARHRRRPAPDAVIWSFSRRQSRAHSVHLSDVRWRWHDPRPTR